MDSQIIRYAIVAQGLAADGFAPNAVVTLESVRGSQDADIVFDQNRAQPPKRDRRNRSRNGEQHHLRAPLGDHRLPCATDGSRSRTSDHHARGRRHHRAEPPILRRSPSRPPTPTTRPYTSDAEQIVDGFQMLVP